MLLRRALLEANQITSTVENEQSQHFLLYDGKFLNIMYNISIGIILSKGQAINDRYIALICRYSQINTIYKEAYTTISHPVLGTQEAQE